MNKKLTGISFRGRHAEIVGPAIPLVKAISKAGGEIAPGWINSNARLRKGMTQAIVRNDSGRMLVEVLTHRGKQSFGVYNMSAKDVSKIVWTQKGVTLKNK